MERVWVDVIGYEGFYQVSSDGMVRRACTGRGTYIGKIISQWKTRFGYCVVGLCVKAVVTHCKVHQLVTRAFLGPCPEGYVVNHKNGNKGDNGVDNLEYVTPSENTAHAHRTGLIRSKKGILHHKAKLTEQQVREIRADTTTSHSEMGRRYGVTGDLVSQIRKGKIWKHLL